MVDKPTLIVNSREVGTFVEVDSYETSLIPVFGDSIETMDGTTHTSVLRYRGEVKFALNPQVGAALASICDSLCSGILNVRYLCLQRNAIVSARMRIDKVSARRIGRIQNAGKRWNEICAITLTEL